MSALSIPFIPTVKFDVLIVGAGMVGASLACALGDKCNPANRSLKVGVIESKADCLKGHFGDDGRASAIALGSSYIWQNIGVWDGMKQRSVTPMHTVQISDGDFPHQVQLQRDDMGKEALGFIVENAVTQASLWEFMQQCHNIDVICPARITDIEYLQAADRMQVKISSGSGEQILETKLLVGADGGRSVVRELAHIPVSERLYEQTCIVVTVKSEHSHKNIAYERFQQSGPFAILPLESDRCCIVWTATRDETPDLLALSETDFMQALKQRFGKPLLASLGKLSLESRTRASYVPRWMHSKTYIQPRLALIGDAAHTTHPVAGQGVNLGIRDVAVLAEVAIAAHQQGEDLGSMAVLKRYQSRRWWDNLGVILLTHVTNRLFSNQNWLPQGLRRFGLLALATLLPAKKVLMFLMMGLHQTREVRPARDREPQAVVNSARS
ncbi:UbiH/UbiF/VisC/COQ6 family ubiquinone biosynthesis hydroxylase [Tumidithrix elongata RA019]|uniref:UbiH/UbiF/VisC/COQ6 family ubiquinone biosynthesis hydroxylase n=1 Tax=Tumidithrix elongata BACA0141 TaxID=2716417 RepID=A0AAW9PWI8_9CYAN|nr:UbiH/UbiF/VisC/COQ6 family ubiquinone biosynthesis hydroxylase [Tumidithrix elongata RA019]